MNQDWGGAAAGDSSEETMVSTPRFDGRAEERARPVVPLDDGEEVTRVRGAPTRKPWARFVGPKNFRRYALVVLPLLALLAAVALAIQRQGRPADVQVAAPAGDADSAPFRAG